MWLGLKCVLSTGYLEETFVHLHDPDGFCLQNRIVCDCGELWVHWVQDGMRISGKGDILKMFRERSHPIDCC